MPPLDYRAPDRSADGTGVALIALPVLAAAVTLLIFVHNVEEEPFGVFSVYDAGIQVGGPAVVLACWIAWLLVAIRRRRTSGLAFALVLGWGVLNLCIACLFAAAYFREPWNG